EATEGEVPLTQVAQAILDQFTAADTNEDGKLDLVEAQVTDATLTQAQFEALDLDSDGFLTEDELNTTLGNEIDAGGCCRKNKNDPAGTVKKLLGDWLLIGLSMFVLLAMSSMVKKRR
ncbi:MAG: hypothetical protein KAH38_11990, partial [Candidatus Hydrogenedentes bacterium]|nr:hypothetical protein [Candidatus Hydrogenedentota bacterium]